MGAPQSGWGSKSDGVGTADLKGRVPPEGLELQILVERSPSGAGTARVAGRARGAPERARALRERAGEPGSGSLRGAGSDSPRRRGTVLLAGAAVSRSC